MTTSRHPGVRRQRKPRDFDYQRYLASREWAVLKEAVKRRASISGNPERAVCERCESAPVRATHHLTYERIGHEELEDLLGVCGQCHEFLSGKSDVDPLKELVAAAFDEVEQSTRAARERWGHRDDLNSRFDLDAATYAARLAQYRILRWAVAQESLPITLEAIWRRQFPEHVTPLLSPEQLQRYSENDRIFAPISARRRAG